MFEDKINIKDKIIPRTLLGTSPFLGAAQFGHRARLYQLDLYNKPENITRIMKKSYELGITGIQLLPYDPLVKALKWAIEDGCEFNIVGTVRPDCESDDIRLLNDLEASSMLIHGALTDRLNYGFLKDVLEQIKQTGAIPGLVTHRPFNTTKNLLNSNMKDYFDIYMVPINKTGYLMDTDVFMQKERDELRILIKKMALNVRDLSNVAGTEAVFIFEHKKHLECIEGVPVVHNWELGEMESSREFLKIIKERKECN